MSPTSDTFKHALALPLRSDLQVLTLCVLCVFPPHISPQSSAFLHLRTQPVPGYTIPTIDAVFSRLHRPALREALDSCLARLDSLDRRVLVALGASSGLPPLPLKSIFVLASRTPDPTNPGSSASGSLRMTLERLAGECLVECAALPDGIPQQQLDGVLALILEDHLDEEAPTERDADLSSAASLDNGKKPSAPPLPGFPSGGGFPQLVFTVHPLMSHYVRDRFAAAHAIATSELVMLLVEWAIKQLETSLDHDIRRRVALFPLFDRMWRLISDLHPRSLSSERWARAFWCFRLVASWSPARYNVLAVHFRRVCIQVLSEKEEAVDHRSNGGSSGVTQQHEDDKPDEVETRRWWILREWGLLSRFLGLFPEAARVLGNCVRVQSKALGSNQTETLRTRHFLAELLAQQSRLADAEKVHVSVSVSLVYIYVHHSHMTKSLNRNSRPL